MSEDKFDSIVTAQVAAFSEAVRKAVSAHHAIVIVSFEADDERLSSGMISDFRSDVPEREEPMFLSGTLVNLAAGAYLESPYEVVLRVRETDEIIELEKASNPRVGRV